MKSSGDHVGTDGSHALRADSARGQPDDDGVRLIGSDGDCACRALMAMAPNDFN